MTDFYWTHRSQQHCSSPLPFTSFNVQLPTITSLTPPSSCCYLICFPRTSESANTQWVRLTTIWSMTPWSHSLHPERTWAPPLSIYLTLHEKPSGTCFPQDSHRPESPRVILNKGVWHVTFLNVHLPLGQANAVVLLFFLSSSPLPQKTDSKCMCRIREILVLADQCT